MMDGLTKLFRKLKDYMSYNKFQKNLFINKKVKIEDNVRISRNVLQEIGDYTFIGENVVIGPAVESIGSFCSIAEDVIIGPNTHDIDRISSSTFIHSYSSSVDFENKKRKIDYKTYKNRINKNKTAVGCDVWIGYRSILLPGITIGNGVIIGAGSVVTKDVEPFAIVAGNPAKFIRYRFNESTRSKLIESDLYSQDSELLFNLFTRYTGEKLECCIDQLLIDLRELRIDGITLQ